MGHLLTLDSGRNYNKPVDLSRTYRLSGLSSGAKLELVLQSRSPSVVSVALQLPESEAKDIPNGRLTDKFPSTTTLWLLLRKFESGANGGGGHSRNFTARGVAQTNEGASGAGRLYYETPVLQAMGRELSSFTDLQKTLGQLGFKSGSILLRLSFRPTQTPLEEAMGEIEQYFKAVGSEEKSAGAHAGSVGGFESTPDTAGGIIPEDIADAKTPPEPIEASSSNTTGTDADTTETPTNGEKRKAEHSPAPSPPTPQPQSQTPQPSSQQEPSPSLSPSNPTPDPSTRPITIFSPPTNTTPAAALTPHNPTDYEPTLDHARLHQSRLSTSARNRRLPTDAELLAQRTASDAKLTALTTVEIKIRFPDQSQVVTSFGKEDSAAGLYAFVGGMLDFDSWGGDEGQGGETETETRLFTLRFVGAGGSMVVPKRGPERLIRDLGMRGRVLVNFAWDEDVDAVIRAAPVLKRELRERAREMDVRDVENVEDGESEGTGKGKEKEKVGGGRDGSGSGKKGGGGVPKWLKLPGKK